MAFELFRMAGNVVLNTSEAIAGLSNVENRATRAGAVLSKVGEKMASAGKALTMGVTLPIVAALGKSVMLASDLAESANVVNVTFGKSAKEVTAWSKTLNEKFGLTQLEAMKYVGSMGAMLKSSGLTAKASKDMSKNLVELTGDISSFYNLGHDEAWEKIRAGIAGETEPLKALGINMSVANMEAYALSKGIKKAWKDMSQAEQSQLRYSYLMKVTADAQGDFARTSDGFANKLRLIKGRFEELGTKIGSLLLPYAEKVLQIVDKWVSKFSNLNTHAQKIVIVIGIIAAALGPILLIGGTLIGTIASLITVIGALSAPIVVVIGLVGVIVAEWAALISVMIVVAAKSGLLKLAFEGIKNIIQIFSSIIKGDTSKALDILVKKFGYSRKEAKEFIEKVVDLKEKIIILAGKIKEGLVKAFNLLVEQGKKATKWIYDHRHEIMKVIEKIVEFGTKIVETGLKIVEFAKIAKNKMIEIKAKFDEKFNEIKTLISNKFDEIKQRISTKLTEWKTTIQGWFNNMPSTLKELLGRWKAAIVKWANEQNEENKRQFGIWKEEIKKWFEKQKENIKIWFKGWLDSLKTSFDNGKKLITGKLDGWWGSIKGWFSGLGKKKEIKDAGKNMINKVSEGNSAKKKDFMDKLGKLIVDVIVGAGKLAFIAAIAAGREIIKRIIDGVNNKIPALKAKISSVLGYITKPIANLSKTLYNSGRNLISNLISGITSKFGDLKNTVMKGAGIIGNFLGFESPTKEGPGKESDKWMPNLMRMLSETLLSKRSLLKDSVQKIAGDLSFNDVSANIGVKSSLGNGALAGAKGNIILNINNPQIFDRRGIQQVASDIKTELQSYMNFKKG